MANVFEFRGFRPVIHESSFIHPNATVTGNVIIGRNVYIGPGAAIRGDFGKVIISDGCNVQENCTIHMFPGVTVVLHENAHIGHGAVIHGAEIGSDVLVGMNAVIMDNAVIGKESIIGALTFIPAQTIVAERSLMVGTPGKVIRQVTDEMLEWKKAGTLVYQELAAECIQSLRPCEPLREVPEVIGGAEENYKTW